MTVVTSIKTNKIENKIGRGMIDQLKILKADKTLTNYTEINRKIYL